jgi:NTP pyrophosphatase (non-canonical NTP hydrolase)
MDVIQWAEARRIYPNSKPQSQLLKTLEELGELAGAEARGNRAAMRDAVGDVLVTLIIYCALRDLDMVDCLNAAYDEIKDRRGTLMPNGVFVKEGA